MVVSDEAYYDFCGQTLIPLLPEYRNLVVLRTFSKWAGLAGLRIGAGAMDPELAATMMGMKPPYNVNLAAEIALLASLSDTAHLLDRVDAIVNERGRMYRLLCEIPGITVWPSQANFISARCPMAAAWTCTKPCAGGGLPALLRQRTAPRLHTFQRREAGRD